MTLFGDKRDLDFDDEISTHLALLEEEYVRRGMSAQDAHDAARRSFGNVLKIRQLHREQHRFQALDAFAQDARFALRVLLRDRAFTLTALLVLGLGIGVNNMLFTIIYGHTLRGLPIDNPDRVLHASFVDERTADRQLSYRDLEDLRSGAHSFNGLAAFFNAPVAVAEPEAAPDRFPATYVTANAFTELGIAPTLGRSFTADEDRAGAPPVVLLGSGAWRARYASDPKILGRTVLVNGSPATVIGIMPDRSGFPSTGDVWLPLSQMPGFAPDNRQAGTLRVFGRVRDEVAVADAAAEIEQVLSRVLLEHGSTNPALRPRVVPISERYLGSPTQPAWLAFITAGFLVLVVSCANTANLMLARSLLRAREIAIRGSLGAGPRRVLGQLLTESVVLAALGGVVGLGISLAGVRVFQSAIPQNTLPYWLHYTMDAKVFAALVAVTLGTVLIFGLIPAIQGSKTDVNRVIKEGGRTMRGGTRRLTTVFMTAQLGLSMVLLSYVVTDLLRSDADLPSDHAINTDDVLTAAVSLPTQTYGTTEQRAQFFQRLEDRLAVVPEVSSLAFAATLPRQGATEQRLHLEGHATPIDRLPAVWTVPIGPGYFETWHLPILQGRPFTRLDGQPTSAVALVNQRFVDMFLAHEDPIGRRVRLTPPNAPQADLSWLTIVGVAQNIRHRESTSPDPTVYVPFFSAPPANAVLILRSHADTASLTARLRKELLAIEPNIPLYRVLTMDKVVDEQEWNGRVARRLVTTLTVIVLILASVGLYAVTAQAVNQRTKEIGIRVSLGAGPGEIRRLVLKRASLQVTLGLLVGIACTMAWDAVFFSGTSSRRFTSPDILLTISALLAAITCAACLVPARRATRLNPVAAIRHD